MFSGRLAVALTLAALCLGTRTAHAQAAPVSYWLPGWPIGFGGNLAAGPNSNTYGNFPSFDGSSARGGGLSNTRFNFSNGMFVGSQSGGIGLNGFSQDGAFGNTRSLSYEGVQFGYNFQNTGSPLTVFGGINTLKLNNAGIGNPFSSFDTSSSAVVGYSAHAGIEFQPTSNLSLQLGIGYTEQPGGDINSLALPGASPLGYRGRR